MSNEEKGRAASRLRFNFLDIAVFLLVVLCVVAAWQKQNLAYIFESDRTQTTCTVAFEIVCVQEELVTDLAAGTVLLTESEDGEIELGSLTDEPALFYRSEEQLLPSAAAEGENAADTVFVDLSGAFLARGIFRDGALTLGRDLQLFVGTSVPVKTAVGEFSIRVLSITEIV